MTQKGQEKLKREYDSAMAKAEAEAKDSVLVNWTLSGEARTFHPEYEAQKKAGANHYNNKAHKNRKPRNKPGK